MKKLLTIFIILFAASLLFGQYESAETTTGQRIFFGNAFWETDSMDIKVSSLSDSLYASSTKDTLFSSAIPQGRILGIAKVSAFMQEISGTSATIALDVRLGEAFASKKVIKDNYATFTPSVTKLVKWDSWNNVMTIAKSTFTTLYLSDSTWWIPADYRQYRLREADADTVRPFISDQVW